jgi:hypothetical protein
LHWGQANGPSTLCCSPEEESKLKGYQDESGALMNRRKFFVRAGLAATAGAVAASCSSRRSALSGDAGEWDQVREQFNLAPDQIDLSALFIASHPKPVRDAIASAEDSRNYHSICRFPRARQSKYQEFAAGDRHCAPRNPGACLSTQVRS